MLTGGWPHCRRVGSVTALFASFDCPRWALTAAVEAAVDHYEWKFERDEQVLTFGSVCEWGSMQQTVLWGVCAKVDDGKGCCFGDLLDRLPRNAQDMIDAMLPHLESTVEETKIAFDEIRVWLLENRKWVFQTRSDIGLQYARGALLLPWRLPKLAA